MRRSFLANLDARSIVIALLNRIRLRAETFAHAARLEALTLVDHDLTHGLASRKPVETDVDIIESKAVRK